MFNSLAKSTWIAILTSTCIPSGVLAEPPGTCSYRQASLSVPAMQVSSKEVGHPWRAMYGYCLRGGQRFVIHQDWAVSYLDAEPVGIYPGGSGFGIGSDLFVRWHPDWQPSRLPYLDAGLGIQYAAGTAFPADATRWNFTVHGGIGWLIPARKHQQLNVSLRYLHISNGGVADKNSGYDVVHLVFGLRWARQR